MKHEIIYTEHYALIVSDEIPNGFYYSSYLNDVRHINGSEYGNSSTWKVIAHRPLKDAPILEGVPLLPKFIQEDDAENAVMEFKELYGSLGATDYELSAFSKGYNKAKETYKYTEEDLINFSNFVTTNLMEHSDSNGFYIGVRKVLELFKQIQKPKRPKYFECETITMNEGYTDKSDYPYQECEIPKTIANSQGQTELVGEYSYE